MKRLIFKKGINKINIPMFKPFYPVNIDEYCKTQIDEIKSMFLPRKNVMWDVEINYRRAIINVTITKCK